VRRRETRVGFPYNCERKASLRAKLQTESPERAVVPSEQTDRMGNFKLFCLPLTNTNQPTCAQRKSIYGGGIGWIPVVLGSFQPNSSYK
jgi:hypothetical protein